jgi:hypothetical protein
MVDLRATVCTLDDTTPFIGSNLTALSVNPSQEIVSLGAGFLVMPKLLD